MNKIECFCVYKQMEEDTTEEKRKNEESNDE